MADGKKTKSTEESCRDPREFTSEWAHRVVFQFHGLAVALRRSPYPRQMQDVRSSNEELIGSFLLTRPKKIVLTSTVSLRLNCPMLPPSAKNTRRTTTTMRVTTLRSETSSITGLTPSRLD